MMRWCWLLLVLVLTGCGVEVAPSGSDVGTSRVQDDQVGVVPDQPLRGTRWRLESLVVGDTVSPVPARIEATLRIDRRGRAVLDTGCNRASGQVRVTRDKLCWTEVITTLRGCSGPRGEVERRVLEVLRGATAYRIDGQRLTVRRGDRVLVHRAG